MNLKEYKLNNWEKYNTQKSLIVGPITVVVLELKSISEIEIPKEGVRNLLAINNEDQSIKWIADLPSKFDGYLSYDNIRFLNNQLEAWCGDIYCVIDLNNGKVLSEEFVK